MQYRVISSPVMNTMGGATILVPPVVDVWRHPAGRRRGREAEGRAPGSRRPAAPRM